MSVLYARFFRPVAAVVALCGLVACVTLVVEDRPRVEGVDPDALRFTLAGVLAVLGVVAPAGAAAASRASAGPRWWGVVVLFVALSANAATLGAKVVAPPAKILLIASIMLTLVMCTVGVIAVAEGHASKPPRSRF